ncbi:hypothetical protein M8818_005932 [Zalaria obscura]|uniref:Uncharacterized protein n=1 Tax=Zalaria obscura TaxID=2024903 RepID=A0ACC3S6G7_9PEZI
MTDSLNVDRSSDRGPRAHTEHCQKGRLRRIRSPVEDCPGAEKRRTEGACVLPVTTIVLHPMRQLESAETASLRRMSVLSDDAESRRDGASCRADRRMTVDGQRRRRREVAEGSNTVLGVREAHGYKCPPQMVLRSVHLSDRQMRISNAQPLPAKLKEVGAKSARRHEQGTRDQSLAIGRRARGRSVRHDSTSAPERYGMPNFGIRLDRTNHSRPCTPGP